MRIYKIIGMKVHITRILRASDCLSMSKLPPDSYNLSVGEVIECYKMYRLNIYIYIIPTEVNIRIY